MQERIEVEKMETSIRNKNKRIALDRKALYKLMNNVIYGKAM